MKTTPALMDAIETFIDTIDRHFALMRMRERDPNYGGDRRYNESRDDVKESLLNVLRTYEDQPL